MEAGQEEVDRANTGNSSGKLHYKWEWRNEAVSRVREV